jgi:AraC-like DNA-binding protein
MLEACTKLKETNPIKEIAIELGFEDPKHFSKFFKKQCGLPPNVYRKIIFRRP